MGMYNGETTGIYGIAFTLLMCLERKTQLAKTKQTTQLGGLHVHSSAKSAQQ